MASRIPPLLEPYLRLPPETSLILLSGVLGSTTNWLVQRYLYSLLASSSASSSSSSSSSPTVPASLQTHREQDGTRLTNSEVDTNVVFVSFLRDYAFWRDGVGRLGLDLEASTKQGRFVFVNGLSQLFHPSVVGHDAKSSTAGGPGRRVLSAATVQHLRRDLDDAVAQVQTSSPGLRTVLIVDQPDLLLAASGDEVSCEGLRETLLDIREKVYASIVIVSADEPLISSQTTTLEKEHAAFALSLAHDAHLLMSLRMLDTGTARDVSGVLRVTSGGDNSDTGTKVDERELLYFVRGDGGVRVFERGQ